MKFSELMELVKNMDDLPAEPRVAAQALQTLDDPDKPLSSLSPVISQAPAICTRILRMVNSAYYGREEEITSLERALLLLGEKTLKHIIVRTSVSSLSGTDGLFEKYLNSEAVGCATASRIIAQETRCADPDEAFLAGMLCHIGKTVMLRQDRGLYRRLMQAASLTPDSALEIEKQLYGFSHDQIGAALLDHWNFAPIFAWTTLHHHDFMEVKNLPEEVLPLAATVNLASDFCQVLNIGQMSIQSNISLPKRPGALALPFDPERLRNTLEAFKGAWGKQSLV